MLRYLGYHHHLALVRDVQGGTIMDKDAAPLITPVVMFSQRMSMLQLLQLKPGSPF